MQGANKDLNGIRTVPIETGEDSSGGKKRTKPHKANVCTVCSSNPSFLNGNKG